VRIRLNKLLLFLLTKFIEVPEGGPKTNSCCWFDKSFTYKMLKDEVNVQCQLITMLGYFI